jgi:protein tyrosine/serine phosphatase
MAWRKTDPDISTRAKRLHAYWDLLGVDHGIFRCLWVNRHRVSENFYRSGQPMPLHVRQAARRGIKTIVNLRGENPSGWYFLERDACAKAGIALVDYPMKSRDAPPKDKLLGLPELFDRIEYPALVHCKSGADRAGLMAALYLMIREKQPVEVATKQMALRFGHLPHSKTGVIDHFFATYAADTRETPMEFIDWVRDVYDPAAVKAGFKTRWLSRWIVDRILRRE